MLNFHLGVLGSLLPSDSGWAAAEEEPATIGMSGGPTAAIGARIECRIVRIDIADCGVDREGLADQRMGFELGAQNIGAAEVLGDRGGADLLVELDLTILGCRTRRC